MPTPPTFADAHADAAGRSCPYCQTAVAEGDAIARCGDCSSVHHVDCWAENTGCAIPGCESAPDPATVAQDALVLAGDAPPERDPGRIAIMLDDQASGGVVARREASTPLPPAPIGLPAPKRRNRTMWIVLVVLVAAVVGALAFALHPTKTSTVGPASRACASKSATEIQAEVHAATAGLWDQHETSEVKKQITCVVRDYLVAVAEGRKKQAWLYLSTDRQQLVTDGDSSRDQAVWWAAQHDASASLNATATNRATITELGQLPPNGARFRVDPLPWDAKHACSSAVYAGTLWARDGATGWRLEPEIPGEYASAQPDAMSAKHDRSLDPYKLGLHCGPPPGAGAASTTT